MSSSSNVAMLLGDAMDAVGDAAELCSRVDMSKTELESSIRECSSRYVNTLANVRQCIRKQVDDTKQGVLPMGNHSYDKREDLEVIVLPPPPPHTHTHTPPPPVAFP